MATQAACSCSSPPTVGVRVFTAEDARDRLDLAMANNNLRAVEVLNKTWPLSSLGNIDEIVRRAAVFNRADLILKICELYANGDQDLFDAANRLYNIALATAAVAAQIATVEMLVPAAQGRGFIPLFQHMVPNIAVCCVEKRFLTADNLLKFCDRATDAGERKGYTLIRSLMNYDPGNLRGILSEREGSEYVIPDRFIRYAYLIAACRSDMEPALVIRECRPEAIKA